jgi:CheY-like chemotaxis protein
MKTVLIVEDETMTRKLLSQIIKSLGHAPILASSAENALIILKDNPDIAFILTDYQMPGMDGLEFITIVRSKPELKRMPILIFSAYIKISEINRIFEAGGDGFLPKPVNRADIADYVHRYLDN